MTRTTKPPTATTRTAATTRTTTKRTTRTTRTTTRRPPRERILRLARARPARARRLPRRARPPPVVRAVHDLPPQPEPAAERRAVRVLVRRRRGVGRRCGRSGRRRRRRRGEGGGKNAARVAGVSGPGVVRRRTPRVDRPHRGPAARGARRGPIGGRRRRIRRRFLFRRRRRRLFFRPTVRFLGDAFDPRSGRSRRGHPASLGAPPTPRITRANSARRRGEATPPVAPALASLIRRVAAGALAPPAAHAGAGDWDDTEVAIVRVADLPDRSSAGEEEEGGGGGSRGLAEEESASGSVGVGSVGVRISRRRIAPRRRSRRRRRLRASAPRFPGAR